MEPFGYFTNGEHTNTGTGHPTISDNIRAVNAKMAIVAKNFQDLCIFI